ncbi:TetR/AcrR family transcriptional regulator [Cellulomonas chengniuliangii]|uniref:TetR/AcrR family transcriptional regulator n=1 Tax=Cellulomonas chengniuliangii TaxID=2968084 RepID=A0ABY5L0R3_9CELL|nr:TetR/AcrR family transcriptional regulator [Cellulomonas chengniuliangii]MCC2307215.1 TetR/AcrR family transcriptional regulator [Cellulomonas chengniuliangii]UUI75989.1 TetR/AcrR family transcriptional regulator [Cellulomonas chengniuliangii]
MPKIQAATVAEHRAAQHRALLDAAHALLVERPDAPPTLAAVGARAGLARSSVYQYFASRDDLMAALVTEVFPRWSTTVQQAMDEADDPAEQVLAYLRSNLELVASGEHAVARALTEIAPGDALARGSREMHDALLLPLVGALTELGLPDPQTTAELVNGVVLTASRLIETGHEPADARIRAEEMLEPFVRDWQRRS